MEENKKGLVCPFCGGAVRFGAFDKDANYLAGKARGAWYGFMHEERDDPTGKCPIAMFNDGEDPMGTLIFDTKREAREVWNVWKRRK